MKCLTMSLTFLVLKYTKNILYYYSVILTHFSNYYIKKRYKNIKTGERGRLLFYIY